MIRSAVGLALLGLALLAAGGCRVEVPLDPRVDADPVPVDAGSLPDAAPWLGADGAAGASDAVPASDG